MGEILEGWVVVGRGDAQGAGDEQFVVTDVFFEQSLDGGESPLARQAAFIEAKSTPVTLFPQQDAAGDLEQEQGNKPLPVVFVMGDVEDL